MNPYDASKTVVFNANRTTLDDIAFDNFRDITPKIFCDYENLRIEIGARGHLKYRKVYPTLYEAVE